MSKWPRASRWLVAMLVVLTVLVAGGCSRGGPRPSKNSGSAPSTHNPNAKPVIVLIDYDSTASTFLVTCDAKLHRYDGDLFWFYNRLSVPVTVTFGGLETPDTSVSWKSPFDPDDSTSFQVPPGLSPVQITRGPNPKENKKTLVFIYTVNGQKPACVKRITGDPGVTVDD